MYSGSFEVEVESHSGYRGEEYPKAFRFGDKRYQIVEILDRWYQPDASFFKVLCEDSSRYILRRDEDFRWTLVAFHSGGR